MIRKAGLFLVFLLLFSVATAHASPVFYPSRTGLMVLDENQVRGMLSDLVGSATRGQAVLLDYIITPAGLIAVILESADGKQAIGWVTADGDHLILGSLFDARGRNLTDMLRQSIVSTVAPMPAPPTTGTPPSPSETKVPPARAPSVTMTTPPPSQVTDNTEPAVIAGEVLALAEQANAIKVGEGEKHLYVVIEPNCGFCAEMIANMQRHDIRRAAEKHGVVVHWIPIGQGTAQKQAASLLQRGAEAVAVDGGRIGGARTTDDPKHLAAVEANNAAFFGPASTAGAKLTRKGVQVGTPTLIWKSDSMAQVMVGAPSPALILELLSAAR